MTEFILSIMAAVRSFLRSRTDSAIEILSLRQQVAVLKRKRSRPPMNPLDGSIATAEDNLASRRSVTRKVSEALPHVSVFPSRTAVAGARSTHQVVFGAIGCPRFHTLLSR